MKKLLSLFLLLAVLLPLAACQSRNAPDQTTAATTTTAPSEDEVPEISLPLKVMEFNMRYETSSHPLLALSYRGPRFLTVIDKYQPDSIGLCEATNDWMNFLRDEMADRGYAYVGVGRDAGEDSPRLSGSGNEHNPVFYKVDKFDLLEGDTIWLSTTPGVAGSSSWNSSCDRICTWVVLKDKETGLTYAHMATHLDHVSIKAQYNAVRVIQMKMNELKKTYGDIGVVLSGDFNAVAFDNTNPDYRPLTYNFTTSFMDDSRAKAEKIGVDGATFNGYQDPVAWENGQASNNDKPAVDTTTSPIDYIFLTKGAFDVAYYTVVNDTFTFDYNGKTYHNHPLSDHYGVYAEVSFTPGKAQEPDESISIDVPATLSHDLPDTLAAMNDLIADASLSSGLSCNASNGVNSLKKTESYAQISSRLEGGQYYWEIIAKLNKNSMVSGVTLQNADANIPYGAECFISANGSDWLKVGRSYLAQMQAGERLTWSLSEATEARYVKIVLLSCPDKARLASVGIYGAEVDSGAIELTGVSGPKAGKDEGYEKMVDGDTSTKFYINTAKDTMADLIYKSSDTDTALRYTFTTANDTATYTDRLPLSWVLYGSVDGKNWVVMDTVTDPGMEHKNYASTSFDIDAPGAYCYYKLSFTLPSSGKMQFSEFVLEK